MRLSAPVLCLAALVSFAASTCAGDGPSVADVKAACLYRFASFVDWPEDHGEDSVFVIGVVDDSEFCEILAGTVTGRSISGHLVRTVLIADASQVRQCQMLYVPPGETVTPGVWLAACQGSPILTVGEETEFLDAGGMIGFLLDGRRVRFALNAGAIGEASLKVSSQLRKLATPWEPRNR